MGIEMMDASHCSMPYIAVILPHDIALQEYVSEKIVEDLVSIDPGVPTLSKQGPLHLHKATATTLGLVLNARSLDPSSSLRLP